MSDKKNQTQNDNSGTIIGKSAKKIRAEINSANLGDTQIVKLDNSSKIKKTSEKKAPEKSQKAEKPKKAVKKSNTNYTSAPIQFSKDDMLGSKKNRLNNIDPYDDLNQRNVRKKIEHKKTTNIRKNKSNNRISKTKKSAKTNHIKAFIKSIYEHTQTKKLHILLVLVGVFIVFSILYIICSASLPSDVIAKNVYIENLNVGGLTYNDALKSIQETELFTNQTVTLKCNGQSFEINGIDIGLTASPEETTQKAFNYTKSTSKFSNGLKAVGLLFHRHTVIPVANINEEMLDQKLNEFGTQVYGEKVGHYVEVLENNEATVWPGHSGFDGDIEKAKHQVLEAFSKEQFSGISVTLNSAPPDPITPEQFNNAVYLEPENAHYDIEKGSIKIIPEVNGRYGDENATADLLATVKEGGNPVTVPWETSYAELTSETLKEKLFKDVLASYSTDYSTSTANRCANIARASQLLNGAIIPSGNIFSFNNQVGERTKYNGFYTAAEYSDGQTVEGIGGGTCQVSTTLYSAVLYAGLDIISRTNHMFSVSYAPLGQDATVSDTGIDFQFRNNTDYPIKIVSFADGSKVYVQVVGTAWEPARTYKVDNTVSYSTAGISVYSQRYTYEGNECVSTEKLPSSYYKNQE